ncbi:MAG: hypothetical protein Q7S11_03315 [bacterium]|nr:hypothetical protein [bacterium]
MLTLYNVLSSDGFIAAKDGGEDFIPDEVWGDFLELCTKYGALIMGKNAYGAIQSFDKELVEPFENLSIEKIVVTRDKNLKPKRGYAVINSLREAATLHPNMLLCSGPKLNTAFLKEKLIDRIILNKLPIAIGEGISQFEEGVHPQLIPQSELDINKGNGRTLVFYKVMY